MQIKNRSLIFSISLIIFGSFLEIFYYSYRFINDGISITILSLTNPKSSHFKDVKWNRIEFISLIYLDKILDGFKVNGCELERVRGYGNQE